MAVESINGLQHPSWLIPCSTCIVHVSPDVSFIWLVFSVSRFSLFMQSYTAVAQKNRDALKSIHRQFVEQLQQSNKVVN